MPTPIESLGLFVAAELPKRPYTNEFPFVAGKTLITTGVGLEVVAGDALGEYLDSTFRIKSDSDNTKKMGFDCSAIATGQTRFITILDTNVTLGRTITGTASQITVTNGSGINGNPTISLADSGVAAATYGSASSVASITLDSKGRATAASSTSIQITQSQVTNLGTALAAKAANDLTSDRIATGCTLNVGTGFSPNLLAGTACIGGVLVTIPAQNFALTPSSDTYIDVTSLGAISEITVANDATPPAPLGGALRIARFKTDTVSVSNVTNFYNLGIGYSSLRNCYTSFASGETKGNSNTAVGSNSGSALTSGSSNCFFGADTCKVATTILGSTFVGASAGAAVTTGSFNTAVGYLAGLSMTTALTNCLFGMSAGRSITTGNANTAMGYNALSACTSGTQNICVGYGSGLGTAASNENTTVDTYGLFIGANASRHSTIPSSTALTNFGCIGRDAKVSTSNTLILGAGMKVGINMITATAWLHLPAGAATLGTAPLKFTSGVNTTVPENGTIEYNGSFYITQGSARYDLGNLPFIATTNSNILSNTTARILGGSSNTASKPNATILNGVSNTANGGHAVVLNGNNVTTTLGGAVVQGTYQANDTDRPGYTGQAAIKQGVVIYAKTTTATSAAMDSAGGAAVTTAGDTKVIAAVVPNGMTGVTTGSAVHEITVIGKSITGTYQAFSAKYIITCSYDGTTYTIDSMTTLHTSSRNGALLSAEITLTGSNLTITATSGSAQIILWSGYVDSIYD